MLNHPTWRKNCAFMYLLAAVMCSVCISVSTTSTTVTSTTTTTTTATTTTTTTTADPTESATTTTTTTTTADPTESATTTITPTSAGPTGSAPPTEPATATTSTNPPTTTGPETTADIGATNNNYTYTFSFETSLPLTTLDESLLTQAASTALNSFRIEGGEVKQTDAEQLAGSTLWDVVLNIEFPSKVPIQEVVDLLRASSFAAALQDQMHKQSNTLSTAVIVSAKMKSPSGSAVANVPTTTTTTTEPDPDPETCPQNYIVAGVLTLILGGLGAGRFYYGYIGLGVLWLFLTLTAHILTSVGPRVAKAQSNVLKLIGLVVLLVGTCIHISLLVWWIYDLVVIFSLELKPEGYEDCQFD